MRAMNAPHIEPEIVINGRRLLAGESMIVRLAIEAFASDISRGIGDDELGRLIAEGYRNRLKTIRETLSA
jgi:hypothetical protein